MESETESQRRTGMDNIGVRIFEESNVSTLIARYHVSSLISNLGVCRCWLRKLHPDTQEIRPHEQSQNLHCSRHVCCGAAWAVYD
ncbi:hypothetical protein B0G69_4370 [Paraburkholderia sp. RAU2J]|nr:hypothetical protein B0G69_4370 [Paraburkholderia sp. RAU2J]